MTPEQRRARSYAAKALLEDETLKAGFAELEQEIIDAWADTGRSWGGWLWSRKRERLWIELRVLRSLRQKLASYSAIGSRD